MKYENLFYFGYLNSIGGIESWYYYMSQVYANRDITLLYKKADQKQLERLIDNIRCIKYDSKQTYECKNLFVNITNTDAIEYIKADKVYCFIHGDYKAIVEANYNNATNKYLLEVSNDKRIDSFVCISKNAQKSWKEITGKDSILCHNVIKLKEPQKTIRLISAQRLTIEKGRNRIIKLLKALDNYCLKNDCYYIWDFFTDDTNAINHPNINYKQPYLDVNRIYNNYDYFVALSDNEGFCYSAVEAGLRKTPCVLTPCPVFKELGFNNKNAIFLNFDCSNIDEVVKKMYEGLKDFEYKPKFKECLGDLLTKTKTNYKGPKLIEIKAIKNYYDKYENKSVIVGDIYITVDYRADMIVRNKLAIRL